MKKLPYDIILSNEFIYNSKTFSRYQHLIGNDYGKSSLNRTCPELNLVREIVCRKRRRSWISGPLDAPGLSPRAPVSLLNSPSMRVHGANLNVKKMQKLVSPLSGAASSTGSGAHAQRAVGQRLPTHTAKPIVILSRLTSLHHP